MVDSGYIFGLELMFNWKVFINGERVYRESCNYWEVLNGNVL